MESEAVTCKGGGFFVVAMYADGSKYWGGASVNESLKQLRPIERALVMDLVNEAGLDVSDWSNYAGKHPASNPRYCYEWVFTQDGMPSVACLWINDMEQGLDGYVRQRLNLWKVAQKHEAMPGRGAIAKRARALDIALQTAFRTQNPIRVIIVDGDQADLAAQNSRSSRVQRRRLDNSAWTVTEYDWTSGDCLLLRNDPLGAGIPIVATPGSSLANGRDFAESPPEFTPTYVARLAYNSRGWRRPATASEVFEAGDTYRSENGFAHEDWLFRPEWLLDGWRYGFVQGVNSSRAKLLRKKTPFDLRLFTMPAPGERRAVAKITGVECLSDDAAQAAVEVYRQRGWFDMMRAEIVTAGGRPEALDETTFAPHVLNLRYRPDNLEFLNSNVPFPPDDPVHRLKRYGLYGTSGAMDGATAALAEPATPELLGVENYRHALGRIQLTDAQRRWLVAHYYSSNSTASMLDLSQALGYPDHRAANGAYGSLARRVAEELPHPPHDVEEGEYSDWMQSIAQLVERNSLGHSQWRLRNPLIEALLGLGWVEALDDTDDESEEPADPDDRESAKDYGSDDTQARQMMLSRRGQGRFRQETLRFWGGRCAVSGLPECSFLIASHIKPWRNANPNERLDGLNGLPLTPNLDRVFDRGFISFAEDGSILISSKLSEEARKALGVRSDLALRILDPRVERYMAYHRDHIFDK